MKYLRNFVTHLHASKHYSVQFMILWKAVSSDDKYITLYDCFMITLLQLLRKHFKNSFP